MHDPFFKFPLQLIEIGRFVMSAKRVRINVLLAHFIQGVFWVCIIQLRGEELNSDQLAMLEWIWNALMIHRSFEWAGYLVCFTVMIYDLLNYLSPIASSKRLFLLFLEFLFLFRTHLLSSDLCIFVYLLKIFLITFVHFNFG